jgi:hypothetical protein
MLQEKQDRFADCLRTSFLRRTLFWFLVLSTDDILDIGAPIDTFVSGHTFFSKLETENNFDWINI